MVAQLIAWYRDFATSLLTDGYLILALPSSSDHPFGGVGPVLNVLCWARDALCHKLVVISYEPYGNIRCSVHAEFFSLMAGCWAVGRKRFKTVPVIMGSFVAFIICDNIPSRGLVLRSRRQP